MSMIRTYHRPSSLEDALAVLADAGARVLGGGTVINASVAEEPFEVVDLQALGLDQIKPDGDRLELGAMVRVRSLVESDLVPAILRDLAHREAPSTLARAATMGGTVVAADQESELLAGLLAFDARLTIAHALGSETISLADFLADPDQLRLGIVTAVAVAVGGDAAAHRTGRTPADRPIVLAVGHRGEDGALRVALTGVAHTPVLVDPADLSGLNPPGDFRGSSDYRRELARVLTGRVLDSLGEAR